MDPDTTLETLRALVYRMEQGQDTGDGTWALELFDALDNWMTHGGYPPASWANDDNPDDNPWD